MILDKGIYTVTILGDQWEIRASNSKEMAKAVNRILDEFYSAPESLPLGVVLEEEKNEPERN